MKKTVSVLNYLKNKVKPVTVPATPTASTAATAAASAPVREKKKSRSGPNALVKAGEVLQQETIS